MGAYNFEYHRDGTRWRYKMETGAGLIERVVQEVQGNLMQGLYTFQGLFKDFPGPYF